MAFVLSSVSGNLISAASAGYAPTNSGDVSAIASAYQVVSATGAQLYAGTAFLIGVNNTPISASRAGQAANASLANSAYYDGTGRLISALPDSAAVSAIASAYAESAASGKQDTLAFAYNAADQISSINGSALGGMDDAAVSGIASAYAESAASSKLDASASSSFYSTANESGFITGVDLSPYQLTADMSSYIPTSMSSDFQQVTGMSSYVPYSSIGYNTASAISGINGSALAGTTYSAGTGIDITDDVISVEAPVDIVAGPGIVIDNPDGNTLRVSVAQAEEVVLWSDSVGSATVTASENIFNFERCRVTYMGGAAIRGEVERDISSSISAYNLIFPYFRPDSNNFVQFQCTTMTVSNNGTTVAFTDGKRLWLPPSAGSIGNDTQPIQCTKIVGIHRTASN